MSDRIDMDSAEFSIAVVFFILAFILVVLASSWFTMVVFGATGVSFAYSQALLPVAINTAVGFIIATVIKAWK